MNKRVVGFVISHSGKPGGPWEARRGRRGTPTTDTRERFVLLHHDNAANWLDAVRSHHPAARILRLVRRERYRAEEAAVVEAAMAWSQRIAGFTVYVDGVPVTASLDAACAALRAKRGG